MDATTRTALVIALVAVALPLVLFSGGMASVALISFGTMDSGLVREINWIWLPVLLAVLLAAVLTSVMFGEK
ncbi:hypothetical protein [Aromatoleum diolicum]|uniref:Uncharacterized protein n=1 Tax=Aromatoleum diolicum TaxID=75796 RepID=A0ABX1QAF6_9RHOO|nr:hypothetical protein [Aromatoleum diolicum]NMG73991.1 hypothetical protein [Aromatoleum diolicum]